MNTVRSFVLTCCALLVVAVVSLAQSNTGRLVGTVISPDGGVVPGAQVVVIDNQTAKERNLVTSGEGTFLVPQLDIGNYTVRVTAPGFKTFVANDVKIDVGREYTLNVKLEIGQTQDSVSVTAGADVVNATNAELSSSVSPRQIVELPLNGRDPTSLITLQAGTASNGATNTSINGQRPAFTNITRDGINIQDNFIRANASDFTPQRPTVDDVAEFTITTQNASADQGYGASQVQMVTPRGQNAFHGALFEYNRNSEFAANDFFSNASNTPKQFLNRNQFGGRIGGPIVPNKLFFFFSTEFFLLRTQASQLRTILTPSARQGTFTYVRADNGQLQTVNLFTLNPQVTGIDPTVQSRILANLPAVGNTSDRGDQRNTTGLRFNQRANLDRKTFTGRLDYDLNERNTFSGVYSFVREDPNDRPDVDGTAGFAPVPVVNQPADRRFLSTAWRWSPTNRLTNEVRGGFFKTNPTFLRTVAEPSFFLTLPLVSSPEVNFQNQGRHTHTYSAQDTADYTFGNHAFRFGGQAQFFRISPFASFDTLPRFTLGTNQNTPQITTAQFTNPALFPGGISTAQRSTANSLLALLGGIVGSATQTFNATSRTSGFVPGAPFEQKFAYENLSLYFADQWRISPRFSLNLGLRYEYFTPLREEHGLALEPLLLSADVVGAALNRNGVVDFIGNNAGSKNFFEADTDNFAPVVSFAWSPQFENKFLGHVFGNSGRTVLRGGFRMSYVNDDYLRSADNAQGGNSGLSSTVTLPAISGRLSTLNATVPTPAFGIPRTFAEGNLRSGNFFSTVFAIDPTIQVPRLFEYNFGIQRELGFQTVFEIRYVGSFSNQLIRGIDFNQVNIRSNGFLTDFNNARANLLLTGNPACTTAQNAGCQPLTVFPQLGGSGFLSNATVQANLINGTPADLAIFYVTNGVSGAGPLFLANPNAGPVDFLTNAGKFRYNGLQVEVRKRFSDGLSFQGNYTFQKTLTNASGIGQTRFEPSLDLFNEALEYARADYDQTHVFNLNAIYELPFGPGKRWLNEGLVSRLLGGWQLTTIIRAGSGAPITIVDARGTLNRAGRSGRQTPQTSLTKDQIKDLIGIFKRPDGVFFINPSVINPATGRGAEGFGQPAFPGQVFFNNAPGQTGSLERAFINGPIFFNWDAGIFKNFKITERARFQFRAELFNVLNRANFFASQFGTLNINSTNFGRIVSTFDPRIVQFAGRLEF
ncbi:MAG: TonB-dependent receptor [Blastocatellia bacterium]